MNGPTGRSRVFQIHPTRLCNLRCRHCYSSSSPEARGSLPTDLVRAAIGGAQREGYTVVSFSGGEPLLYPDLGDMLGHARAFGLRTTVTTNGTLLRRSVDLADRLDLLAISLDGRPASHNRMRASQYAFEKLERGLPKLRDAGIPFGFIFTLTQYNVHELEWVADFAATQGAQLLQVHPLEEVGRAKEQLTGASPDVREATVAFAEALRLQKAYAHRLAVQVDLVHRRSALHEPERLYAGERRDPALPLSDLVSPLILEPDATLVPLQYGFARAFAVGNLYEASFAVLAQRWKRDTAASFAQLCRQVFETRVRTHASPFFNWYEAVSSQSYQSAAL